jgi:hypothetical protein
VDYVSLDEAAKGACQYIWDHEPDAQRFEFCGLLYEQKGAVRAGLPITSRLVAQCWPPPEPPENTSLLGRYHSHRWTPEPSPEDSKKAAKEPALGHYLCAPSHIVRRFSTAEGTVIVR